MDIIGQTEEDYFSWLCNIVNLNQNRYRDLAMLLNHLNFTWVLPMDADRAADGVNLRRIFATSNNVSQAIIQRLFGNKPCSVLEMLVALARRCEDSIMYDASAGDRTSLWFWRMICNLDLERYTNGYIRGEEEDVINIVNKFLHREYTAEGYGNIFIVPNCEEDLRGMEIWYQMSKYLLAMT